MTHAAEAPPEPIAGSPRMATVARPRGGRSEFVRKLTLGMCIGWLAIVAFCALLGPMLPLQDPDRSDPCSAAAAQMYRGTPISDLLRTEACPEPTLDSRPGARASELHKAGLDETGRDILARLVSGARVSMFVGVVAVGAGSLLGTAIALFTTYYGGRGERLASTVADIMLSFPAIVLVICVVAVRGQSLGAVSLGIAFYCTPTMYRMTRGSVRSVLSREYLLMDKILGVNPIRTIRRAIVPNIASSVVTYMLVLSANGVVVEGGLAFLGLSVPQPTASWGSMINGGQALLATSPHVSFIPSIALVATVAALGGLAEQVRRRQAVRPSVLV